MWMYNAGNLMEYLMGMIMHPIIRESVNPQKSFEDLGVFAWIMLDVCK